MAGGKPTVLVLWGNYFDECAAAAFVCELRAAGIRVRLVGVDGKLARGRHGLVLAADISLERAFDVQGPITHVIAPCSGLQWQALQNTAHVARLIRWLAAGGTAFVVPGETVAAPADREAGNPEADPPLPLRLLRIWPQGMEAVEYARSLGRELVA
jgi:hypothetical protein